MGQLSPHNTVCDTCLQVCRRLSYGTSVSHTSNGTKSSLAGNTLQPNHRHLLDRLRNSRDCNHKLVTRTNTEHFTLYHLFLFLNIYSFLISWISINSPSFLSSFLLSVQFCSFPLLFSFCGLISRLLHVCRNMTAPHRKTPSNLALLLNSAIILVPRLSRKSRMMSTHLPDLLMRKMTPKIWE